MQNLNGLPKSQKWHNEQTEIYRLRERLRLNAGKKKAKNKGWDNVLLLLLNYNSDTLDQHLPEQHRGFHSDNIPRQTVLPAGPQKPVVVTPSFVALMNCFILSIIFR